MRAGVFFVLGDASVAQSKLYSALQHDLGFPNSAFFSSEPAALADALDAVQAWLQGEPLGSRVCGRN